MADIIAGIAPRVDTHANWTALNPTLGKDSGGNSYGQIIISTGSPVGNIMLWGNGQTYNAAYTAGQYAPISDDITITNLTASGATSLQGTTITDLTASGITDLQNTTVNGQLTLGYMNSRTVTANATLGAESVLNVDAGTATITIPDGLPVGTRKRLRKISGVAGTVTYNFSGTESVTRAGLTSITSTSDGDFWDIEKATAAGRWELADGVESGSNANGDYYKHTDGTAFMHRICSVDVSVTGTQGFAQPISLVSISYAGWAGLNSDSLSAIDARLAYFSGVVISFYSGNWNFRSDNPSGSTTTVDIYTHATGRWYT